MFPYRDPIKLRKSIIVTGASSGIGRATVIKLVESGYQVFGLARSYNKLTRNLTAPASFSEIGLYIPIEFDITKPKIFDDIISKITSAVTWKLVVNFNISYHHYYSRKEYDI